MKFTDTPRFFLSLLCGVSLLLAPLTFAQDGEESSEQSQEVALTQGRAAVLLANSLGLYVGQDRPLTPDEAIQLLMAEGISPFGGWKPGSIIEVGDVARILVQALGLDSDFSEEQVNDPSSQAYKDTLVENFGIDIDDIVAGGVDITSGPNPVDGSPTDPEQAEISIPAILVSEADLQKALADVVPTPGGTGTQVDGGSSNITPSAP